ncbi:hypothetical protein TBLA_0B06750 [Henningerozyma blattae CBS 6284]|uniref:Scaffold protein Nfu/NifU N-terminal domain-containing protein n=1 Tax=Henningerozyma blattae (strain ATCC 34711 / CBS 6284 / DSM 70876 / NBRC 10599 / NRRL Y-10934 / UCD 77-7) TaxID=1071380 RepID=I2GZE5_HENB6|nr:hypothetical protein TBLA_0B06750 [Tetrapisispora blattae CBS 6284]CCH59497.1 hypothetical protein TBLA_0B06750 [Tetrapisispora blattae CBS 6284]
MLPLWKSSLRISSKSNLIRNSLSFRRYLNIKTLSTPNENALKFVSVDGELLQPLGSESIEIKNTDSKLISNVPLADRIFKLCKGVDSLMIGDNFLTINKDEFINWQMISPIVIDLMIKHLASGHDTIKEEFHAIKEFDGSNSQGYELNIPKFELTEDDEEVSEMIDELIKTRIRPAIQDDGGDIQYRAYDPNTGTVYLKLQGACKSCSSSEDTLKYGIESMLKHYVEEVQNVVQMMDPEEEIALKEFEKLEQKLSGKCT